jgi:hypothetical protein
VILVVFLTNLPVNFPTNDSAFERLKMPVTILTRSRVVAAPARIQRYNILDAELKGFGVRIESNGQKFWFLQTMKNGRRSYQ